MMEIHKKLLRIAYLWAETWTQNPQNVPEFYPLDSNVWQDMLPT